MRRVVFQVSDFRFQIVPRAWRHGKHQSAICSLQFAITLLFTFAFLPTLTLATQPTLDDLLNIAPPEAAPSEIEPSEAQPSEPALDPALRESLSAQEAGDLFSQAIAEMDQASRRLGAELDAGLETQRIQEAVLAKLDRLIADAEQSQQSGGRGEASQQQPQDQGSEQNAAQQQAGAAQAGEPNAGEFSPGAVGEVAEQRGALDEHRSEWGSLPARLRSELMQGMNERFSPIYRELTERYFQRLAEEEP